MLLCEALTQEHAVPVNTVSNNVRFVKLLYAAKLVDIGYSYSSNYIYVTPLQ